jgi:hypothetical protein
LARGTDRRSIRTPLGNRKAVGLIFWIRRSQERWRIKGLSIDLGQHWGICEGILRKSTLYEQTSGLSDRHQLLIRSGRRNRPC